MPVDYGALARKFGGTVVEDDDGPEPMIPGNINLGNRPRVRNADGSVSTVRSIGVNVGGREYLIPTVSDDGRILTDDQAFEQFRKTGKHLGAYGTVAESNAAAKRLHDDQETMVAFDGMRPMVAHTPRGQVVDFAALAKKFGGQAVEEESDAGTLNEELHTPPIGIDPRLEPESMMNEAQAAEIPGQILGGYANYATMAAAPTMMGGARAIVTGAARSRLRPMITGAAMGAGQAVLRGDDVARGAIEGAVIGAGVGPAVAATTVARKAAPDAAALLKVARSATATAAERHAARVALQKMGWVPAAERAAEAVTEVPTPVVKQTIKTLENRAKMPVPGNVKPATVYTKPNPVQGAKPLTEMQIVTRGRQEEAAKAAGLEIGDVFGSKAPAATKVASRGHQVAARHKALMAFGKEVATRNPKVGEKIWILLDDAGNPVKQITPAEAGAAARKGSQTTWIANLWTN